MAHIQRWCEFFDILDTDHNGYLDPNDLKGAAKYYAKILHESEDSYQIAAIVATQAHFLQALIKDWDANKDGKISKDEFLEAVKKVIIGKSAEEVPGNNYSPFVEWWKASIHKSFEAGDINNHGSLSLEEIQQSVQMMNPNASAEKIKEAYDWATEKSGGKYDAAAHFRVSYAWANELGPTPASILTPYFSKLD